MKCFNMKDFVGIIDFLCHNKKDFKLSRLCILCESTYLDNFQKGTKKGLT